MTPDPIHTVAQAAAELGISPGAVYRLCGGKSGKQYRVRIRHTRHGSTIRIRGSAIREYEQSCEIAPTRPEPKAAKASAAKPSKFSNGDPHRHDLPERRVRRTA